MGDTELDMTEAMHYARTHSRKIFRKKPYKNYAEPRLNF